ncbi:MAG: tRNA delta(2)-isopentenylpyrophosphate transferase, tRNA dimethylallyltransferase [Candidatus Parcubacteria bacterium]|jgi:tRNA dimethylallyltransferase
MKKKLPKVLAIVGPTATGKSDLAVEVALLYDGEIISADSRQVYKGMDIGTGKITVSEMKGIPHYLLDVIEPKKVFDVELFKTKAEKTIADIVSREKLPIVAGGTGFYIDALISGEIFPDVPANKKLRAILAKKSAEALMKEITKLDPRRAKALDPFNKVRIIRAIEIARALGSVPMVKRVKRYETLFIGLTLDSVKLREKIHIRLLKRIDVGMIKEISNLHKKGLSWKRLHDLGLEYRYVALYLQKKITKEEMVTQLEQEIAHYAKRQMQWFKRNTDIKWFAPGENKKIAREVKKFLKN